MNRIESVDRVRAPCPKCLREFALSECVTIYLDDARHPRDGRGNATTSNGTTPVGDEGARESDDAERFRVALENFMADMQRIGDEMRMRNESFEHVVHVMVEQLERLRVGQEKLNETLQKLANAGASIANVKASFASRSSRDSTAVGASFKSFALIAASCAALTIFFRKR